MKEEVVQALVDTKLLQTKEVLEWRPAFANAWQFEEHPNDTAGDAARADDEAAFGEVVMTDPGVGIASVEKVQEEVPPADAEVAPELTAQAPSAAVLSVVDQAVLGLPAGVAGVAKEMSPVVATGSLLSNVIASAYLVSQHAPRGLVLQLAPKKALRVLSASAERTAAPPAASGRVPGEVADPTTEVAPVTATGGVVTPSGVGEGVDPAPLSASSADPAVQSVIPRGPQAGEVIDLDTDEAEGAGMTETGTDVPAVVTGMTATTEEGEPASTATARTATMGQVRTPALTAVAEEAAVTEAGTSAREVPVEVAPAAEAEVPAPEAPAGVEEPAAVAVAEGEVAVGILVPPPALEAVVPSGGPTAALTAAGARAPGPSASPAASGMMEPVSMAASGSAPASASAASIPRAGRGSVLRCTSREDPPRHLFTFDDAAEWHKWQAVQGGLANARTALSSVLGELDSVVLPGSQVAAAQQVINDLERREQAAQEDVRRSEAKFQAIVDKACLDREELQAAAAEKERDFEAARKGEAEKMAAELGAEVGQLRAQVQGLQTAVS
nr:skin secretory protein xP2-like [Setaria viridis]